MEYIEIPSRLNRLTLEELENLKPDIYMPIFNKLADICETGDKHQERIIKQFAEKLAVLDLPVRNTHKGVHYIYAQNIYRAEKRINGKYHYIKMSKNHQECVDAYNAFCKLHKVKP